MSKLLSLKPALMLLLWSSMTAETAYLTAADGGTSASTARDITERASATPASLAPAVAIDQTAQKAAELELVEAAKTGQIATVQRLIRTGTNVNARTKRGTALTRAAFSGHTLIVKLLLTAGAKVDLPFDQTGTTPLMMAIDQGHRRITQLLLAAHADPNAQNKHGATALTIAAFKSRTALTQQLLAAGAVVLPEQERKLPKLYRHLLRTERVLYAATIGDLATIQRLSPSVARKDSYALSYALAQAAQNPSIDDARYTAIVRILSKNGADLNFSKKFTLTDGVGVSADEETMTAFDLPIVKLRPLDLAIQQNQRARVQTLLTLGADPLHLAEETKARLAAFTLTASPAQPAERAIELAAVKSQRLAELQRSPALVVPADQERYLADAFAIAQLVSDEIIKPPLERRLMTLEDHR